MIEIKSEKFWKSYLFGIEEPFLLPFVAKNTATTKGRNDSTIRDLQIKISNSKDLQKYAHLHNLEVNSILMGVWAFMLSIYTRKQYVVFGVSEAQISSGFRKETNEENITLPVYASLDSDQLVSEWLKNLQKNKNQSLAYADTKISSIQNWLGIKDNLFDTLLNFKNNLISSKPERFVKDDQIDLFEKFSIIINVNLQQDEEIFLQFGYLDGIIVENIILKIIDHFNNVLHQIIKQPNLKLSQLNIVTLHEKEILLEAFNAKVVDFPKNKTLIDLFEDQVIKQPNSIALIYEDNNLTYAQLNDRANQLAHFLNKKGITLETIVPICIDRSLDMIVGLLGIQKAGGAYLPIDPSYPQERVEIILEETKPQVVISSNKYKSLFIDRKEIELVLLDNEWDQISKESSNKTVINLQPTNLAYIIYTSGSTGKPKGVQVEHMGVVNLLSHQTKEFSFGNSERVLQIANYVFDASVEQIYLPLCNGAILLMFPPEQFYNIEKIQTIIKKQKVTHIHCTPSYLKLLTPGHYGHLKRVIAGGEICSVQLAKEWEPFVQFYNKYGPTEVTITSTEFAYFSPFYSSVLPIGKPISNTPLYILDIERRLVPQFVAGELYIGGVQVARGYHNNAELTKERFLPDPFSKDAGNRMYRSGDLVRWLPDGNVEFLGRLDDQVKIRGFRIELGEIENVIRQSKLISQVVVLAKADQEGNNFLVGYIIAPASFDKNAIISWLKERLPNYMVPMLWVVLDQFPLNHSGKIDKKALPEPNLETIVKEIFVAPSTKTELLLSQIWKRILSLQQIGVNDNFFELGGNSLFAMHLISQIYKKMKVNLEIKDFFSNPTISLLSHLLEHRKSSVEAPTQSQTYLIPIKKGNIAPIYIVCGIGGSAFTFYNLAKMLDENQAVHVFQQPSGEDYIEIIPKTVEELATAYVRELLINTPQGPFILAAHCVGVSIVVEMTKQLEKIGKEVSLIVLFDPEYIGSNSKFCENHELNSRPSWKQILISKIQAKADFEWYLLRNHTKAALFYKFSRLNTKLNPFYKEDDNLKAFNSISSKYRYAAKKHILTAYEGKTIAFFPEYFYSFVDKNQGIYYKKQFHDIYWRNKWKEYFPNISIYTVDGEHSNMFEPKYAKKLSSILQKYLNDF
ncbi:non-ribosomal peptide synthetase [Pleomorphovibrio marinus]|uniref:non-ribosomal peptide synthetase n=1 Tax=Pleomorphovibrio marinus TaxID=2164132 RepID=UPI000E0A6035|nr:non-ribosomal peptide synthetase [Pleomorphovibrio marinus]